jgi:DNA-binding PadR family transcriptional regulator
MVVVGQSEEERRPKTKIRRVNSVVREQQFARETFGSSTKKGQWMRKVKRASWTTPDLVVLSLLAEREMHGYEVNLELERREVRDWAGISRPQIYYSLEKLAGAKLISAGSSDVPAAGPERRVFKTTAKGRQVLSGALEREEWATQRDRPPFLTWIALSWQARPGMFRKQVANREKFLKGELAREEETLHSILKEVGHAYHEAAWMVALMIEQFKTELRWLRKLKRELPRRASAKNPDYAQAPESTSSGDIS